MSSDEKLFCTICGEELTNAEDYVEINGDIYCLSCAEENFTECDDCGKYVPKDEIVATQDGDHVCQQCLEDNYTYCEHCEEYVPSGDIIYLSNYDTYLCQDCLDNNYTQCCDCGEYIADDEVRYSDNNDPYCESCYDDNYYTCEECGCEVHRDDVYEHDGYYYCQDCYDDIEADGDSDNNNIYSYHGFNHNNYIPRYADDEATQGTHLYGMELEVAGSTRHAREVVDRLQNNAIAMYDSSVDGFELVFMPMSRRYIYEKLKPILDDTLKFMTDNGFRGHNKGGIHVHFTKLENSTQVANMTKIMYGSDKDKKIWLKITQRKESAMHWCSMSSCVPSAKEIIENNIYAPAGTGNHGTALNYCTRTQTHELRIFNSNTRIERVMKNLECVFALEDYVARASEPICDTRGFLTYVDENAEKYPTLVAFLIEKKVFDIANRFYGDTYNANDTKVAPIEVVADVEPAMTITAEDVINMISEPADEQIAEEVA